MEQGLVLDKGDYNMLSEQEWMEGPVEKSIWTGIKTNHRQRLVVETFRCESCGYLESYANQSVDK